jgi:hypothetical protein
LPIGEKTESWFNYFSIESNQIKAKELLDPFRKENRKEFDFHLQAEYDLVYPTARPISSIRLTVPSEGPFEDLEINEYIQDSRLIPITQTGDLRTKFDPIPTCFFSVGRGYYSVVVCFAYSYA